MGSRQRSGQPHKTMTLPLVNKPSPWLAWLYLGLAGAGAILPWLANLDFIRASAGTFDLALFIAQANANPAAQSLSRDLLIGATAFTIWMVVEAKRLQIKYFWVALLASFGIAFACGAPLFLFLRERRLQELTKGQAEPQKQL